MRAVLRGLGWRVFRDFRREGLGGEEVRRGYRGILPGQDYGRRRFGPDRGVSGRIDVANRGKLAGFREVGERGWVAWGNLR